jgi:uncharacterized protein
MMTGYLDSAFNEPFRDPVWGDIGLSTPFKRLTATKAFQHLAGIRQLGPAYLVYPGAVHTRLLHSLGVFHLARRLLQLLARSGLSPQLGKQEVDLFLASALFHDLGHFPFAHSLKELPLKDHEKLTGEIVSEGELGKAIRKELGLDPQLIAMVVDQKLPLKDSSEKDTIIFFRTLLSGVLDPDKLDYLNRDAFFCGVPYGYQDVDNILARTLMLNSGRVGVDPAGTVAVENLLFSKYLMYRTVYWHKTVRIATAMIKQAIMLALADGHLAPEELYRIDDAMFFRKISEIKYPPLSLVRDVQERKLFKMVAEIECCEDKRLLLIPMNLEQRLSATIRASSRLSERLGRSIRPEQIIADIPEPISFETDLKVLTPRGETPFSDSGTIFSKEVITGFSRNLRKVRIFVDPSLARELSEWDTDAVLELFA